VIFFSLLFVDSWLFVNSWDMSKCMQPINITPVHLICREFFQYRIADDDFIVNSDENYVIWYTFSFNIFSYQIILSTKESASFHHNIKKKRSSCWTYNKNYFYCEFWWKLCYVFDICSHLIYYFLSNYIKFFFQYLTSFVTWEEL